MSEILGEGGELSSPPALRGTRVNRMTWASRVITLELTFPQ